MSTPDLNREASLKVATALLAELGVDIKNVGAEGVSVEQVGGLTGKVLITWQGIGWLDFTRVTEILREVQA